MIDIEVVLLFWFDCFDYEVIDVVFVVVDMGFVVLWIGEMVIYDVFVFVILIGFCMLNMMLKVGLLVVGVCGLVGLVLGVSLVVFFIGCWVDFVLGVFSLVIVVGWYG